MSKQASCNAIVIITVLLGLVAGQAAAAPASQEAAPRNNTALVLVNSTSTAYSDFPHLIQPYLDHFGVPYTVQDISRDPVGANAASYAVIIVGHRRLDTGGAFLNAAAQANIVNAVRGGVGLVNFDNDLSADGSTARYAYVQNLFNFGYVTPPTAAGVRMTDAAHYITERHTPGETISTGDMALAGVTAPPAVTVLAASGSQPFLAVAAAGDGRVVQWGTYAWMSASVKGPQFGLDDLVWRSIVWAARKPFVMQGLPPFVTMRMDDVLGPLWWIHAANDYGLIPWAGIFIDDIDAGEAVDLANLVRAGKATTNLHANGTGNFFYFDHYNGRNFSDDTMAGSYSAATRWFADRNIPRSRYLVPHYYEIGSNAFAGLADWNTEFIGTMMDPGQLEANAPWMMSGPYRLYEPGAAYERGQNPYYADFMRIPGHPELDGKFFNCVAEVRDITGYEWLGNGRTSLAAATQDGTAWLKRSFDSMTLATLFTHEYTFIDTMSEADWRAALQGITQNIAPYHPIYVSMDDACRYLRAVRTSDISASTFDPTARRVTTTFAGKADIPTRYYLFTEPAGAIQQQLLDGVPAFDGTTAVTLDLSGPLHHITVSPGAATVVSGATRQFTAQGYDASNRPLPGLVYAWQVVNGGGTINAGGLFTAGTTAGTYPATVVASVDGIAGTATVEVARPLLEAFAFDPIAGPRYAGVPFPVTITARDQSGNLLSDYTGRVTLSASSGAVEPAASAQFTAGRWSGNLTLDQAATGVTLSAHDGSAGGVSSTFDVVALRSCPCSIFASEAAPAYPGLTDGRPIETGVKFRSDIDGYITGLRFYKGISNAGRHDGHLWTATGSLLAEATFAGESASGWQEVLFSTPVPVTANQTYVASYFSAGGYYAGTFDDLHSAVDNAPLHVLADGVEGPNGVFRYDTPGFPQAAYINHAPNYWVDVIFVTDAAADTTPPAVNAVSPAATASGVRIRTTITASFSEAINPATLTGSTFQLRNADQSLVEATVTYDAAGRSATLTPWHALANATTYTAIVKGGTAGVKDRAGNALASDYTWSFTTAALPPALADEGPGGPILVVASAANPFGRYLAEILHNEGLNEFAVTDISRLTADMLAAYDVVVLSEMPLTTAQVSLFGDWVNAGGNLIAMRPDPQLAGLLGLTPLDSILADAYLLVNTAAGPGAGIVDQTIQFHGPADRYTLDGATAVATLYADATTATANPAVVVRDVGTQGGQAAAFTFDLARSVVYTRQGNPAWAGQKRDGAIPPIRSDDLFYPDWVNSDKIAIPQADEQQRLLANLILQMNLDKKPLPRFWYFPRAEKAVVIMTGDDHDGNGTAGRFEVYRDSSPANCSVEDWQCVRSTSYIYPTNGLTAEQAAAYTADGFEVGLHVNTNCSDWTPATLESMYGEQLLAWQAAYPGIPAPTSERTHCIAWSDWNTQAHVELSQGARLDTNYYYWPPTWVQDRPGLFTGSGMPMPFADVDGMPVDVYQAATHMTDESGQSYPYTIDALLDRALGTEGYYGAFTANLHTDVPNSATSVEVINAAQTRGVPIVSGRQMLEWLDGRNGSSFGSISWAGGRLSFGVTPGYGANGLRAMLPARSSGGRLAAVTRDGAPVAYRLETIKGVEYAIFAAEAGGYVATYAHTAAPVVSDVNAVAGENGAATITWNTDEPSTSSVDYGIAGDALTQNTSSSVLVTAHVVSLAGLAPNTTYYYRVTAVDESGNAITYPAAGAAPLEFTVPAAPTLDHITISPQSATVSVADPQAFSVEAFDALGSSLGDVTASAAFASEAAAGGAWSGNVYQGAVVGDWTVTATYSGKTATAALHVRPATLPPDLPATFNGALLFSQDQPATGALVEAFLGSASAPAATSPVKPDASYQIDVPNGVEGEPVTFVIAGRTVAVGAWHKGSTRLDFHPPAAALTYLPPAVAGAAVTLDASGTRDAGSPPTEYLFDCNADGVYELGPQSVATTQCRFALPGSKQVRVEVRDSQGGTGTATATVDVQPATTSITLRPGWNLVSFSVVPPDTRIAAVLASLGDNYDLVFGWDSAEGAWRKYAPRVAYGNTLDTLDHTQGFWIHITGVSNRLLTVLGTRPTTTTIHLVPGWNLVGFPAGVGRDLPAALRDGSGQPAFAMVYAFRPEDARDQWKLFDRTAGGTYLPDLTALAPGWGYWVLAPAAFDWTVDFAAP